jgi:LSD1 subclass zinc finger protein
MTIRPLTQDDLRWLVCPVCHQALMLSETGDAIRCAGCARVYPIVDGLPVLLAARATTQS